MLGSAVCVGDAAAIGVEAAGEQLVAAAADATVLVGVTDVLREDAAPGGLVADPSPGTVLILAAGDTAPLVGDAVGPRAGAVLVVGAAHATSFFVADSVGAVNVGDADLTGPCGEVARRPVGVAVGVQGAAYAAVPRGVAVLLSEAVLVSEAAPAARGLGVAGAVGAVAVVVARDAEPPVTVAGLLVGAVFGPQATHARVVWATAPIRTVGVVEAADATLVGDLAAPVGAVLVHEALDADPSSAVVSAVAVRVLQAADAGLLLEVAALVRTVGVLEAGDALTGGGAAGPGAVRVDPAVQAPLLHTEPARPAGVVVGAADAAVRLVAATTIRAVGVDATGDAGSGETEVLAAVDVFSAGDAGLVHAATGVTVGVLRTGKAGLVHTAARVGTVPVLTADHARGVRAHTVGAVGVLHAGHAAARGVAHATAQTVTIRGALDAHAPQRVADRTLRALSASSALHALV